MKNAKNKEYMEIEEGSIMSYIWHEPHTDFYWIGSPNGKASVLVDVAGICRLLSAWRDPRETVYDLQQLLLDWVVLTLMPDRLGHDISKDAIYQDMSGSVHFTRQLHECICVDSLKVSLYNEYVKRVKAAEDVT